LAVRRAQRTRDLTDRTRSEPRACRHACGVWVALERLLQGTSAGNGPNTVVGRHVAFEASGNIVYTEGDDDLVVTVCVHDLVVEKRGNTVLLVAKHRVQDVKAVLAGEGLK